MLSFILSPVFSRFVTMIRAQNNKGQGRHIEHIILDMSNFCTGSFPEFVPFCPRLYYFSSFKAFKEFAQAW